MTDALMTDPDQEEALSRVYAHAVAARAGYVTANYDLALICGFKRVGRCVPRSTCS